MDRAIAIGFNWVEIEAISRMAGIKINKLMLDRLSRFENIYIGILNERSDK